MTPNSILWLGFGFLILFMFALDLLIFNKKSHEIKLKEAAIWTGVWLMLALLFNCFIYAYLGVDKALEFLTAYLVEESLSVDNLFVFILIFSYFNIKKQFQPKILKWGIFGAIILRGVFIFAGIELLERFQWLIYIFGAILVYTGIKMALGGDEKIEPEKNILVKIVRKFIPILKRVRNDQFFVRRNGITAATPLFLALIVVESSDLIFAIDSIPAVIAVSQDPLIVYTSNIFAIMGLRSLYYLLAHLLELFIYLKLGISFILVFVGIKMLLVDLFHIPILISLGVILFSISASVASSMIVKRKDS